MSGPYSHTPGPWAWRDSALVPVAPCPDTHSVHTIMLDGQCYGFLGSDNKSVLAEDAANRTLIAAAPAMLAALRKARDCILIDRTALADCSTGPDGIDEDAQAGVAEYDETLAVIDAAIAQAEGLQ